MDKKGLSPLTSTVILLIVSIIIGIIVMSWGKGYVEKMAVKTLSVTAPAQTDFCRDLNKRVANGEITQAQYDQMKQIYKNC